MLSTHLNKISSNMLWNCSAKTCLLVERSSDDGNTHCDTGRQTNQPRQDDVAEVVNINTLDFRNELETHHFPSAARQSPSNRSSLDLYLKMWFSTLLTATLGFISAASAHNILLRAHSRECFHENLHKGDKMTVTFQTGDREFGGSGNLDVNFWVYSLTCYLNQGPEEENGWRMDGEGGSKEW